MEQAREERSTEGWVGLGIRTVKWHPTGDWLAVGGWDGKVSFCDASPKHRPGLMASTPQIRVLTRLAWAPVAELFHVVKVVADRKSVV